MYIQYLHTHIHTCVYVLRVYVGVMLKLWDSDCIISLPNIVSNRYVQMVGHGTT